MAMLSDAHFAVRPVDSDAELCSRCCLPCHLGLTSAWRGSWGVLSWVEFLFSHRIVILSDAHVAVGRDKGDAERCSRHLATLSDAHVAVGHLTFRTG